MRTEPALLPTKANHTVTNQAMAGWDASLSLNFAKRADQTILARRQHRGPLVVQKMLYPEGSDLAHGVIVHPPGGVAGGDKLQLSTQMQPHTAALLTTPGATKWYKSAGRQASQHINFSLKTASLLEWLPQENIVFDAAEVRLETQVQLCESAVFAGWEVVCLGRQASGEYWHQGRFQQRLQIKRDKRLIWNESAVIRPSSRVRMALAGLDSRPVFGSFVVAAGEVPSDVLQACRDIVPKRSADYGVSALPEVFTARYMGVCAQDAKHYFDGLWQVLRPWYAARPAIRPRIWAT
ncbi:Urease accessory protein UreD [Methylophaga frappieri]|uniref:Urease accessory protein UreD n=1 Tax=Methylophaga frappieri (strain ATCC BAA-2434 / DSM 25690 / JAM7) TaxID=754477 RepID=I1YJC8_METFJ|nr:urease accessory protein UreD [Methylophaga frappieri]AFJ03021.1 Urease accessory protein UreD [Methylophaga frappieri]